MLMYNLYNKTHSFVYFIKLSSELQKSLQNLYTSKIVIYRIELTEVQIYEKEPGVQYKMQKQNFSQWSCVCLEQKSHVTSICYKMPNCFNSCNKYTLHIHRALMHSFW